MSKKVTMASDTYATDDKFNLEIILNHQLHCMGERNEHESPMKHMAVLLGITPDNSNRVNGHRLYNLFSIMGVVKNNVPIAAVDFEHRVKSIKGQQYNDLFIHNKDKRTVTINPEKPYIELSEPLISPLSGPTEYTKISLLRKTFIPPLVSYLGKIAFSHI